MATLEQLEAARQKALKSPLIGKRGKGVKTLEKEERRRIFDELVTEEFQEIIKAARPEYKLDQYLGKAPDKIEHSGEIKTSTPLPPEALAIIEADLKKRKTGHEL